MVKCQISGLDMKLGDAVVLNRARALQRINRLIGHLQRHGIKRIDSVAGSGRFKESEGKT